jgi:hypothetical protein
MTKLQNRFVIFGAIAAAALAVPGVLGPLTFDQAYAQPNNEQSANALQNARGLVVAQVAVPANVNVQDVDVDVVACVIAEGPCTTN